MPNYRRLYVPGGTYFFTLTLDDRSQKTLTDYFPLLWRCYRVVQRKRPFDLVAGVVLPDHLHVVITLPDNDADFSTRIRMIKQRFTYYLPENLKSNYRNGERRVWQPRFWEHLIRDEDDLGAIMNYVYYNPLKHGHVSTEKEWPYSTWHWHRAEFAQVHPPSIDLAFLHDD